MRRIPLTLAASAAAVTLLLAGCASSSDTGGASSSGATGGYKSVLTLGMNMDIQGWDPGIQPGYQGWAAEGVWDQLAKCDATGQLTPDVADTFEITDQNATFKAHIREGMKFSDGTPVDSAAVKASFDYVSKSGQAVKDYEGITIDTPDAQNISITWPEPQPTINNKICAPKIAPASYLTAGKFDVPVGSGPYVLDPAATTRGSVYTLTKNPNHWDTAHYPYQKLVVKVIESDTAAVSALTTGQIDAALVPQA